MQVPTCPASGHSKTARDPDDQDCWSFCHSGKENWGIMLLAQQENLEYTEYVLSSGTCCSKDKIVKHLIIKFYFNSASVGVKAPVIIP
jgi:hypothetical protein